MLHVEPLARLKGEKTAIMEMRIPVAWHLKGLKETWKVRTIVNQAEVKKNFRNLSVDYEKIRVF